jgi:threonine synthase
LGWRAPDTVILPVGNGTLLIGAYIGFNDLLKSGIIKKVPKFVAVQASNCSPLAKMFFDSSKKLPNVNPLQTVAEGIAIANPVRIVQIVEIVRKSGGTFITVEEEEILQALHEYSKRKYYMEPTAAAIMAGVKKYVSQKGTNELIVSTITRHGLKHVGKI